MTDILGTNDSETLNGTDGDDVIRGLDGNDSLFGGAGNDTLIGGLGSDTLDGGDGIDTVDYSGSSEGIFIADFRAFITGFPNSSAGEGRGDTLSDNIENIIGTPFADRLVGTNDANVLDGNGGADLLIGLGGADTLIGNTSLRVAAGYTLSGAGVNVNLETGIGLGGDAEGDVLINIRRVFGSRFNDTLTGVNDALASGSNLAGELAGGDGDDLITGGAANDSLNGGLGDDTLIGGAGNDTLVDERGDNVIDAGAGDDFISIRGNSGTTTGSVDGGSGTDQLLTTFDVNLTAGTASFTDDPAVRVSNVENVTASTLSFNVSFIGDGAVNRLQGYSFDDFIDGAGGNDHLIGLDGDDTIVGGTGDDLIETGAGTDTVVFRNGHGHDVVTDISSVDIIDLTAFSLFTSLSTVTANASLSEVNGQSGTLIQTSASSSIFLQGIALSGLNSLTYSFAIGTISENTQGVIGGPGEQTDGDDTLTGTGDSDLIEGGDGNDVIAGIENPIVNNFLRGSDTLRGQDGDDDLTGNDIRDSNYADLIDGGPGNDTLRGLDGPDTLIGGPGADTFFSENSIISLFAPEFISYSTSPGAVDIDTGVLIENGRYVGRGLGSDAEGDILFNAENIIGSDFNDTISAGGIVRGGGGDDYLTDNSVTPIRLTSGINLNGNEGNDTLVGTSNAFRGTSFNGGSGQDLFIVNGDARGFYIDDYTSEDTVDVSAESLEFTDVDTVVAAASLDASNNLQIEIGDNRYLVFNGLGLDDVRTINFIFRENTNQPDPVVTPDPDTDPEPDTTPDPDPTVGGNQVERGGNASENISTGNGDDRLIGLGGADTLVGNGGDDFISGGTGDDIASGGEGNDQIFAGPGDTGRDLFIGATGNDVIGGGAGNDTLIGGGTNAETVRIHAASDGLSGDAGSDTLYGGAGEDVIIVGGFDDVNGDGAFQTGEQVVTDTNRNEAYGGDGNDTVYGAAGNDTLGGGIGNDFIVAGAGNDTLYGGRSGGVVSSFNDTLHGGDGDDQIFAGSLHDSVDGGAGNDTLFGGSGQDTVSGGAGDDQIFGGAGIDTLSGGTGADTFFFAGNHGEDEITDFDVSEDTLFLVNTLTDFQTISDVIEAAFDTVVTNGSVSRSGLVINTGEGTEVFIVGLSVNDLINNNVNVIL